MARPKSEELQHRRWLEDARKHLGRGDLDSALPVLLRLPTPLREEVLPRGAALFRKGVHEQHHRGAWGTLSTLAARAEAEPGLVERGVEAGEARATFWPLMWAAARAREWARAQRLWQPLSGVARAHAPVLAGAVDSWLSAQGAPSSEALAPALACLPPVDPRLGVEPSRQHASPPPPRSVAEVEGALLVLCALEPFPVFAGRAETWAREAPADVVSAVWELAGQLAARELWLRAAAGKGGAVLREPSLLLARAVREGGAVQALETPTLQALRVVTTRLREAGLCHTEEAEAWCALAQAAALFPEARPWVVQAVSGVRFSEAALPRALRLYETLLALGPDATLWGRAFLSWCQQEPEAYSAPKWLQEGLRQLLATQASALLAWLRGASPSDRAELIECVASTCAVSLVESWVEACWEEADEALRRELSEAISILLDRSRSKKGGRGLEQVLHGARDLDDVARVLMDVEGALEEVHTLMRLSPEGLRIWRRFAPRVLSYRAEFLEEAVRQAASDTEMWEAVERYLAARPGDTGHLEVLRTLEVFEHGALAKRVLALWLERRANNVQALAEAAVASEQMGTPCKYSHKVLEAFLRALEEQAPSVLSGAMKQAQELARGHQVRLRKRGASGKKKADTKDPMARASSRRRTTRKKAPKGEGEGGPG
ncbi:DUF6109 family natural product biosynthesis protein [Hyalangium rubrum]|uniref:DUF6109 family natural product biosynthesis protein n=1 Tax=Hyalangium rubrum TaxID=3103134 RepID=A0ABU5H885_9BACT|nr:DUF6109 family natural product biosynthesis protein [Hyalangium sp. s54d21]MDY7229684.1 DUF6109 family natural product biosynthesis protein [Hyalangium sp. s54d21]